MRVAGRVLSLPFDNIDTDQIIPAAHLTTLESTGLGRFLFTGHPDLAARLDERPGASIVVAGRDFGCGSSREHAVWALLERGFRAVIAPSFARIFSENAYTNALVPIALPPEHTRLCAASDMLDIDVESETVTTPDGNVCSFSLDPLRKTFLQSGGYLEFVHARIPQVRAHQASLRNSQMERLRLDALPTEALRERLSVLLPRDMTANERENARAGAGERDAEYVPSAEPQRLAEPRR